MAAILIVDDEAGIREFLAEALAADGHETTPAADGVAALGSLRAREFDLMITDLKMPGPLDGVGLLRQVRPERPEMPVIVLTAHGTVETAVEAMKLGAFDFLEKPLGSLGQLRVLVWRALERRKALVRDAALRETRRVPPLSPDDPVAQLGREVERALGTGYQVEDLIGRGGYAAVFRVY